MRTFVAPLLKKHGFGATFYICEFEWLGLDPRFPGKPDRDSFREDKRQYMTWEQIRELDASGFEVGNHTGSHALMKDLPREKMLDDVEQIERRCEEYGIRKPVTFAYPVGVTSPEIIQILREKQYALARIVGERPCLPESDDLMLIPSFSICGTDEEKFFDVVRQAQGGKIVVLTFHGVPDYTTNG